MAQMILGAITWLISFGFVINGGKWLYLAKTTNSGEGIAAAQAAYGTGLICVGIAIKLLSPFS